MSRFLAIALVAWTTALVMQAPLRSQTTRGAAGDPLPGLLPAEFEEFRAGLEDFLEVETAEDGLGPAFNGTSCAACHNIPAIGGAGVVLEVRAGYRDGAGVVTALNPQGDTLIHMLSVPSHGCQPQMPDDVTVVARRAPIPLFGAGLVEAIADETIAERADPEDRDGDGISGRVARVVDVSNGQRRVGRFGWKAQHATLLTFAADAYRNEMGITNDIFPREFAFGVSEMQMRLCDPFPDPEDRRDPATHRRGIDNFESFMRFLAPPPRSHVDAETLAGERLFASVGCASCHVPALVTDASSNPLFHRKTVALFSDLLLHDIGTGDGIRQASAEPGEIRTPALWGLRFRRPLLHDGSAATVADAIAGHRGEAELARRGYERLTDSDRQLLLAFLRSL